jgi:hypothetical protein
MLAATHLLSFRAFIDSGTAVFGRFQVGARSTFIGSCQLQQAKFCIPAPPLSPKSEQRRILLYGAMLNCVKDLDFP